MWLILYNNTYMQGCCNRTALVKLRINRYIILDKGVGPRATLNQLKQNKNWFNLIYNF